MNDKKKYSKWDNKFEAISYSLKDAVAISIGGFPLRLNEIALTIITCISFSRNRKFSLKKMDFKFLSLLYLFIFLSFIGGVLNYSNIDTSFYLKFMIRGVLYVVLTTLFLASNKMYADSDIHYLCKAILGVNTFFFIVLYTTGYRLELGNIINSYSSSFQIMNIFGIALPRFFGTATEAGYMGPFLMMPLYYFFYNYLEKRKYKKELVFITIMLVMTFSAIVYLMSALVCYLALRASGKVSRKISIWLLIFVGVIIGSVFYFTNERFSSFMNLYFLNKLNAIFSNSDHVFDYSGSDRRMHYQYCIQLINQQSFLNRLLGAGTGFYSGNLSSNLNLYSAAEEAYNLYLSTILDRGIIGLALIIGIAFYISKYYIKNDYISTAIYIGIISQYIHWLITGNMWLCYFWMEVMYLIGYYKKQRVKNGKSK